MLCACVRPVFDHRTYLKIIIFESSRIHKGTHIFQIGFEKFSNSYSVRIRFRIRVRIRVRVRVRIMFSLKNPGIISFLRSEIGSGSISDSCTLDEFERVRV